MKLTFLGANHEVTGSKTLLTWREGCHALIDCGMEQGHNVYENAPMPVNAADIQFVFLTHAHIDHTGMLPKLYREGFRGKVYATRETCLLSRIMLADCAHIQESEAEYKTRKALRAGNPPVEPEYTRADVQALLPHFVQCDYGIPVHVADGLDITFSDMGHLLGSSSIICDATDGDVTKRIVFSGDVGNSHQPILNDPVAVKSADFLMVESTYGNRLHEAKADPRPMLTDVLQRTLDRGGNVIIPSFAVGRTQEMLYLIREIKEQHLIHGHDNFPVYVDSPLSSEATEVFMNCNLSCLDEEAAAVIKSGRNPIRFEGLHTIETVDESRTLNYDKTPKVIISSSGMCDAGRIRHHLKFNLWRPECTVLFVGYQSNGTLGRIIMDGADEVMLYGDKVAVNCEVAVLEGVSGHADKNGLLDWVSGFETTPPQIFVNHGDHEASEEFVAALTEKFGVSVDCPYSGSVYDLAESKWEYVADGVIIPQHEPKKPDNNGEYNMLLEAIRALSDAARSARHLSKHDLTRITHKIKLLIRDIKK